MKKLLFSLGLLILPLFFVSADKCTDFAGASLIANDGTFIGYLSVSGKDAIGNRYGTYGSPYNTKSIFNQYGTYGSQYNQYSPWNQYSQKGPYIIKQGVTMGILTLNRYVKGAQNPFDILGCFVYNSDDRLKPFRSLYQSWYNASYVVPKGTTTTTAPLLTADESCQLQYGMNSMAGDPGKCKCKAGYIWNDVGTACIALTENQKCQLEFGSNAMEGDGVGYCKCKPGYKWSSDRTYCTLMSSDESCQSQYGVNSMAGDPGKCICKSGYKWNSAGTSCVVMTENEKCELEFGSYSYSPEPGYCNCISGYQWSADGKSCVKTPTSNISNDTSKYITTPANVEKNGGVSGISDNSNSGIPENVLKAKEELGSKAAIFESLVPLFLEKDKTTQENVKTLLKSFESSRDNYTKNIGIYFGYLVN